MLSSELERLNQLRQAGALSEVEFQQAKQRVLQSAGTDGHLPGPEPANPELICGLKPNIWLALMHASQLLTYTVLGIVVPVVMWIVSRDESKAANQHGLTILNWMLSALVYAVISGLLCVIAIGIPMLIVLAVLNVVFPIIGAIQAANGRQWKYPLTINFLSPGPA
jgi:uncharacterized Tic20 family protein